MTEPGQQMYRAADVALRTLREAAERIAPGNKQKMVTVTSSMAPGCKSRQKQCPFNKFASCLKTRCRSSKFDIL